MAKNLVDKLDKNKIKLHTVLFDSWYSDKDLIKKCRENGARVICAVKTNRNIFIGKSNVRRKISFITDRIIIQDADRDEERILRQKYLVKDFKVAGRSGYLQQSCVYMIRR